MMPLSQDNLKKLLSRQFSTLRSVSVNKSRLSLSQVSVWEEELSELDADSVVLSLDHFYRLCIRLINQSFHISVSEEQPHKAEFIKTFMDAWDCLRLLQVPASSLLGCPVTHEAIHLLIQNVLVLPELCTPEIRTTIHKLMQSMPIIERNLLIFFLSKILKFETNALTETNVFFLAEKSLVALETNPVGFDHIATILATPLNLTNVSSFLVSWLQMEFAYILFSSMLFCPTEKISLFLGKIAELAKMGYLPPYMANTKRKPFHAILQPLALVQQMSLFQNNYLAFDEAALNPFAHYQELLEQKCILLYASFDKAKELPLDSLQLLIAGGLRYIHSEMYSQSGLQGKKTFFSNFNTILLRKELYQEPIVHAFFNNSNTLLNQLFEENLHNTVLNLLKARLLYANNQKDHSLTGLLALLRLVLSMPKMDSVSASDASFLASKHPQFYLSIMLLGDCIEPDEKMIRESKNSFAMKQLNKYNKALTELNNAFLHKEFRPLCQVLQKKYLKKLPFLKHELAGISNEKIKDEFKKLVLGIGEKLQVAPGGMEKLAQLFRPSPLNEDIGKKCQSIPMQPLEESEQEEKAGFFCLHDNLERAMALSGGKKAAWFLSAHSNAFQRIEPLVPNAENSIEGLLLIMAENVQNKLCMLPQDNVDLVPRGHEPRKLEEVQNEFLIQIYSAVFRIINASFKYQLTSGPKEKTSPLNRDTKIVLMSHNKDAFLQEQFDNVFLFLNLIRKRHKGIQHYMLSHRNKCRPIIYYLVFIIYVHKTFVKYDARELRTWLASLIQEAKGKEEDIIVYLLLQLDPEMRRMTNNDIDCLKNTSFFVAQSYFKRTSPFEQDDILLALVDKELEFPDHIPSFIKHHIQIDNAASELLLWYPASPDSLGLCLNRIQTLATKNYFPTCLISEDYSSDPSLVPNYLLAAIIRFCNFIKLFKINYDLKLDYDPLNTRSNEYNHTLASLKNLCLSLFNVMENAVFSSAVLCALAGFAIDLLNLIHTSSVTEAAAHFDSIEDSAVFFQSFANIFAYAMSGTSLMDLLLKNIELIVKAEFREGFPREVLKLLSIVKNTPEDNQSIQDYRQYLALYSFLIFLLDSPFLLDEDGNVFLKDIFQNNSEIIIEELNSDFLKKHCPNLQDFKKELFDLVRDNQTEPNVLYFEKLPKDSRFRFQGIVLHLAKLLQLSKKEVLDLEKIMRYDRKAVLEQEIPLSEPLFEPESFLKKAIPKEKKRKKKYKHSPFNSIATAPLASSLKEKSKEVCTTSALAPTSAKKPLPSSKQTIAILVPQASTDSSADPIVPMPRTVKPLHRTLPGNSSRHLHNRGLPTLRRDQFPEPVLQFVKTLMKETQRPLVLGGSAVTGLYVGNHNSDYDIRIFNLSLNEVANQLDKLGIPYERRSKNFPILNIKLTVNDVLYEIEITTGRMSTGETLNKAMNRLTVDFNIGSLYIPFHLAQLETFDKIKQFNIVGSVECLEAIKNEKITLVDKPCAMLRLCKKEDLSFENINTFFGNKQGYVLLEPKDEEGNKQEQELFFIDQPFKIVPLKLADKSQAEHSHPHAQTDAESFKEMEMAFGTKEDSPLWQSLNDLFLPKANISIDATREQLDKLFELSKHVPPNRVMEEDFIRVLRLIKYLLHFKNFRMNEKLDEHRLGIDWKQCIKDFLFNTSSDEEEKSDSISTLKNTLYGNSQPASRISTTLESMFGRFKATEVIKKMDELKIFQAITDLSLAKDSPLEKSLELLKPFENFDGYMQKSAFCFVVWIHFCKSFPKISESELTHHPLYHIVKCLQTKNPNDRAVIQYITHKLLRIGSPIKIHNSKMIDDMIEKSSNHYPSTANHLTLRKTSELIRNDNSHPIYTNPHKGTMHPLNNEFRESGQGTCVNKTFHF